MFRKRKSQQAAGMSTSLVDSLRDRLNKLTKDDVFQLAVAAFLTFNPQVDGLRARLLGPETPNIIGLLEDIDRCVQAVIRVFRASGIPGFIANSAFIALCDAMIAGHMENLITVEERELLLLPYQASGVA